MNKLRFELRTHLDHKRGREAALSRERLYRIARLFLFGAAVTIGLDMVFNALNGGGTLITLRSIFGLSQQDGARSALALILTPIELIIDAPLWLLFLVAGAIPYAIAAVHQFLKEESAQ